jgi:hypothetical protein
MPSQHWSSCVFCAWSVPRGYKSQHSSVVSRCRSEVGKLVDEEEVEVGLRRVSVRLEDLFTVRVS